MDTNEKKTIGSKVVISVIYDIGDFTIGRIPIFGTFYDLFGVWLGYILWGPIGLINAWELLDPTDQIDGFIPTMSIVATKCLVFEKGRKAR